VVRRFRREIEAVSKLSHPNLVTASNSQEEPSCHFLAMEYFQGLNLDRIIAAGGPLPLAPACDYIRQAALGLQHVHDRGLIHRDIKPGNLLVMPPSAEAVAGRQRHGHWGTIKILDLGFVLLQRQGIEDPQAQLTRKGFLLGTVDYTAPEQAADPHSVDIRADLYSLGCTFYEMLTGRLPYLGSNPFKKLHQHQTAEPPPLTELRADLPPAVVDVVRRLMAKSPAERYQQPNDLAEEMTRILDQFEEATLPWDWQPPTAPRPRARNSSLLETGSRRFIRALVLALALTLVVLVVLRLLS
jgi:serine/threonine protein kinase